MRVAFRMQHLNAGPSTSRLTFLVLATPCLVLALVTTGCDESERRAISPGAVSDFATAVAKDDPADSSDDEDVPIVSGTFGQTLLPEADRIYFAREGDVWQISRAGQPSAVFTDHDVIAFSASARGERLAIVHVRRTTGSADETTMSLVLPRGTIVHDLAQILDSPFSSELGPIDSIALTPNGSELALAYQSGQLMVASLEGEVHQLNPASDDHQPGSLRWSADGRILAWVNPWMPSDVSSLWVAFPELGTQHAIVDATSSAWNVIDAAWIPGTTALATIISTGGTIDHGGDLFLVDAISGERELLVSSGQFAPVAGVVDIAVTPGGDRLALTAYVPGENHPEFDSLWILDLETRSMTAVEINANGPVTDLWWLGDRLLLRVIDDPQSTLPGVYTGRESFMLLEHNPANNSLIERYDSSDDRNRD